MKFTAAFCILATGASAFGLQTPAKAAARAAAKVPFMPAKQAKVPMVQPIDIDGVSSSPEVTADLFAMAWLVWDTYRAGLGTGWISCDIGKYYCLGGGHLTRFVLGVRNN